MSNLSSPFAYANPTEPTNSDVYVFARFDENAAVNQYSFDGRKWEEFAAGMNGVPFEKNGVVYFRSLDAAGEASPITTIEVTNIDKIPPDAPVISAQNADTFEGVFVSATFSKDSVYQEYSFEGKKWMPYEGTITVTDVSTVVTFRATDAAGNESYAEYKAENFPVNDGLNAPIARPSTTEPTNSDVFVTAIFDADATVNQFSTDGQNWEEYADGINGIPFAENGTVHFRSLDAAGSVSPITTYVVSNIDKTPPEKPVISIENADTFEGVFVSATFSKDSVYQEYSFEAKKWIPYQDAVPVTEVGTVVFFRGTDAAGNVSEITECKVESFAVGPAAPVATASTLLPTNSDVTVTATFDETAAVNQYSRNGLDWFDYTGGIVLAENDVVYFRSLDADGRESAITPCSVENIDKVAPNAPYAYADITEPTNQNVTVFARFSEDSVVREFRTDGSGIWYAYSEESSEWAPKGGVQLVDNDTVYFRGTDAAGNVSEETSFTVSNIDKTPPTKPTVTVTNADLPAGKGVYLTVSFSEDSATKEYSLDGENWQDYQDAILVTEGGKTVFFRGTDAVGNVSDVTRYTVDNRLFAPAAPVAYADITEPTNQDVTVYATFDENAVVRKYAIGNISKWYDYTDAGVVVSNSTTVFFACTDANDTPSEITSFEVSNIDKTPPEKPRAEASVTEDTMDPVFVSATFSNDSVIREYSLDGETWQEYTDPIRFTKNDTVWFRAFDAVGNVSETQYVVDNIYQAVDQAGDADDGWNNYVYSKKSTPSLNLLIEDFQANVIGYGTEKILLDKKHSISVEGWDNFVGKDNAGVVDAIDFAKLTLDYNSKVSITVEASAKGAKARIWWLQEKASGKYSFVSVASAFVSHKTEDGLYSGTISALLPLLDDNGEKRQYFISVECPNASKGIQAYYNAKLDVDGTVFFDQVDNSDDWTDLKEKGAGSGMFNDSGVLNRDFGVDGWVGFGDEIDYYKFTLESAATLCFRVEGSNALSFSVYSLEEKKDKYSLKPLQTLNAKPKKNGEWAQGTTKAVLLAAGEYYFSVTSTTASSGAYVDYGVWLADGTEFYTYADDGWNNWLYDKKQAIPLNPAVVGTDAVELEGLGDVIPFDKDGTVSRDFTVLDGDIYDYGTYVNYVGIGDGTDIVKVHLEHAAKISFSVHATDSARFSIYSIVEKKNGYTQTIHQATALKQNKAAGEYQAKTKLILLEAGDYYLSMNANDKKAKTFYNVCIYSNDDDPENSTVFYNHESKYNGADITTNGKDGDVNFFGTITEKGVILSEGDAWVGFGDPIDYGGFEILNDAQLCFTITATDVATFKLYTTGIKNGKTVLSVVQIGKLKLNKTTGMYEVQTKPLVSMQGGGTFYYSVESTKAKAGGSAYYEVELDDRSIIAPAGSGDDNWDDRTTAGYDGQIRDLGVLRGAGSGALLDGWVGIGDAIDYAKFTVAQDTTVSFRVEASDEFIFHVGQLTASGLSQKTFKYVKAKKAGKVSLEGQTALYGATTSTITLKAGTTYFLDVCSYDYSKKKGLNVDYKVYVSSFVASEIEPNDWGPASDASADLAIPGSAASLDDWTGSASDVLQDSLFACQTVDEFADSALANSLDDEAARRLNAELSILA